MKFEEIKLEDFHVIEQPSGSDLNTENGLYVDDGLLFGIGFFETILILENAFFLEEHVTRINNSLEAFGIKRRLSEYTLRQLIVSHAWRDLVLKIVITDCNTLAITRAVPYTEKQYQDGFSLTQSAVIRGSHSAFAAHKSLNYGENIWAVKIAKMEGYNDCLFANEYGHITESALANFFIIEEGQLITPPLSDGLLPGIIRSKVMENFPVREESITPERILKCQGAFLTNSILGVMKVHAYVGLKVQEHPIIETIRNKILEEARSTYVIKN